MQNYGPDQSQGQFWVTVCDVVIPDIYKLDLLPEKHKISILNIDSV